MCKAGEERERDWGREGEGRENLREIVERGKGVREIR